MLSALRNAGQTCICANRVFVHAAVHDKFAGGCERAESVGREMKARSTPTPTACLCMPRCTTSLRVGVNGLKVWGVE